jgi:hypothetical protein
MANAINIPKSHLILGLSLPLAVMLGYFVAEPMELGSLAVVVLVLAVLAVPLLMKCYYPLLVLGWNAAICFSFLPGQPTLWALMALVGLLFAVLNRAVSAKARFVIEPSITKPLLVLAGVVVATGLATGGFGVHSLGAGRYGGRRYFYFLAAVAGYFVFTSRRIPPHRVGLYMAMFFLSALTFAVSDFASFAGSKLDFLWLFLAPDATVQEAVLEGTPAFSAPMMRLSDLSLVGTALYAYLLARFGIRGLLDLMRPWRLLLLLLALVAGLASGFRSFVVLGALTFAILFYMEGLHRTRYVAVLLGVALLGGVIVLPQAERLPLVAQRALSFLPGKFDFVARESAASSADWRLGMWREVLPEVPKCLFRGKGWGIDAREFSATENMMNIGNPLAGVILAGDFHNGPLSILIPFGLYGAIAFVWFLVAGLRVLHRNWKLGSPAFQRVNALLLAAFAAHVCFFFFFFGSLHSDMAVFTGLLGLSVALNGVGASLVPAAQPSASVAFSTEYVKV